MPSRLARCVAGCGSQVLSPSPLGQTRDACALLATRARALSRSDDLRVGSVVTGGRRRRQMQEAPPETDLAGNGSQQGPRRRRQARTMREAGRMVPLQLPSPPCLWFPASAVAFVASVRMGGGRDRWCRPRCHTDQDGSPCGRLCVRRVSGWVNSTVQSVCVPTARTPRLVRAAAFPAGTGW